MKNRSGHTLDVQNGTTESTITVLETFPAGAPRGSWPAEEYAAARRAEGIPATVVMDLATDTFVVKTEVTV
ncbi:hypothetical protein ACFYQT_40170 [Streptomyces tibetensis]|uniref:Uncharacterized protein n=1 Tax=Streptomyces tibetensis TaxID=2382123 RepID=A0ABW6N8R1_9ACTN